MPTHAARGRHVSRPPDRRRHRPRDPRPRPRLQLALRRRHERSPTRSRCASSRISRHALGPSGDDLCVPKTARRAERRACTLDHVVLSHPHLDHGSALDLVVHCYDVKNVWDSGRVNDAVVLSRLPHRRRRVGDRALSHRGRRPDRSRRRREGHRDQDRRAGSGSPRTTSSSSARRDSSRSSTPRRRSCRIRTRTRS